MRPVPSSGKPGDLSHDYIFYSTPYDLRKAGYQEQGLSFPAPPTWYNPNPTTDQQQQVVTPIGSIPYTTRIVVCRAIEQGSSAGVAVLDWQNVTAGHDIDTEWGTSADYLVRLGWTWVGADVQQVGVNGATSGATAGFGLTEWDHSGTAHWT